VPLSDPLADIANRIVSFYERRSTAPFLIYQYEPADEYAVRRDLVDLRRWLEADPRSIECHTVSLAEIFWEAIEEHGQLDMVIDAEQAGAYDEAQLAVRQVLASPPTLADRIVCRVAESGSDRSAIFLYRAGALYPSHRTSPLLDALKDKVERPVTLLYPGRVVGDYGLSFMGRTEVAHGYRAFIIERSTS
jgi:BREX protein BrxB